MQWWFMDTVDYKKMSAFFKALGNSTRLKILMELAKCEKCVGDVESIVRLSQANISQHLSVLKECGIVDCRKEGNMRCYFLRQPALVKKILNLVEGKGNN